MELLNIKKLYAKSVIRGLWDEEDIPEYIKDDVLKLLREKEREVDNTDG